MAKRFITYFQSVITVGIMTKADNEEEAAEIAQKELRRKNLNHCYFDQTDFEQAGNSLEWTSPDPIPLNKISNLQLMFDPTPEMCNVIASRLNKNPTELTIEDYAEFIKESLGNNL